MNESKQQAQYRRLKTRLTTKNNKLATALKAARNGNPTAAGGDVLTTARAVIVEVDYANTLFEATGYPDAWANWTRAKDDAEMHIRRLGGKL